jgi:GNAT superfamily N-acetyltransferase
MPEVVLRPMTAEEFRGYRAHAIQDYADEVRRNTGVDAEGARKHAERAFTDILPDGLASPGHRILVAEDPPGERIGLLWLARLHREGIRTAWIYDVAVEEPLRGRGYGRRLMEAAEEQARGLGVRRLELNVFGDNERARRLYGSMGFVEMSRQLYKELPEA